jgi:hypothetical protein
MESAGIVYLTKASSLPQVVFLRYAGSLIRISRIPYRVSKYQSAGPPFLCHVHCTNIVDHRERGETS